MSPAHWKETGGKSLLNLSAAQGSLQAVSLTKIQLLGHPNQSLPVTNYIYHQKIYGVFKIVFKKGLKALC